MENEDGEVIKKYDLPTQKPHTDLLSQGLKYMGMGIFAKAVEKPGEAAAKAGESSTAGDTSAAQKQRKKNVVAEQEEDDDRHIRFTIGGIGRRMTKEDFIEQMQKLDKSTRHEVVDKSDASRGLKALAKQDAPPRPAPQITVTPAQPSTVSGKDHAGAGATRSTQQPSGGDEHRQRESESSSLESDSGGAETGVELKKRLAALKGVDAGDGTDDEDGADERRGRSLNKTRGDENEDDVETAAERRRREAALGIAPHAENGEDSDDDNTPRVPPSRSIRFADTVARARRE